MTKPLQLHTRYVPEAELWDDPYCAALAEFTRDDDLMAPWGHEALARCADVSVDDAKEAARRLAVRIGLDAGDPDTVSAVMRILLLGTALNQYL